MCDISALRLAAAAFAVVAIGGVAPSGARGASPAMVGYASWYGAAFEGRPMANGCPFHHHALTAASRVLPLGARIRVRFRHHSIVVPITDRGPYWNGRILDLSEAAASRLGMAGTGVALVEIQRLTPPHADRTSPCQPRPRR